MSPSKPQPSHKTSPSASSSLRNPLPGIREAEEGSEQPFKSKASVPKDSPADSRYSGAWWNPFSRTNNTAAIKSTLKHAKSSSALNAEPPADAQVKERKLFVPRHAGRDARLSIPISNRQELHKIHSNVKTSKQLLADRMDEERSLRREARVRQGSDGVVWDGGFSPAHLSGYAGSNWAPGEYLKAAREGILSGAVEQGPSGEPQPDCPRDAATVALLAGLSLETGDAISIRSAPLSAHSQFYTAPSIPGPKFAGRDSAVVGAGRGRKPMHSRSMGSVTDQAIMQAYLKGLKDGAEGSPHAVTAGGDTYAQLTATRRNPTAIQPLQTELPIRMTGRPQSMFMESSVSPFSYEGKGKGRATDAETIRIEASNALPSGRPASMIEPMPPKIAEAGQMKRGSVGDSLAAPGCTQHTAVVTANTEGTNPEASRTFSAANSDPRSSISRTPTEPSCSVSERGGSVATTDTALPVTPDTPLSTIETNAEADNNLSAAVEKAFAELGVKKDVKAFESAAPPAPIDVQPHVPATKTKSGERSQKGGRAGAYLSEKYDFKHEYDWSDVEAWLQASAISMTPGQARRVEHT